MVFLQLFRNKFNIDPRSFILNSYFKEIKCLSEILKNRPS